MPSRKGKKGMNRTRKTLRGGDASPIRNLPKAAPLMPVRGLIGKKTIPMARCNTILNAVNRQRCHERCNNKPLTCSEEFWG